MTTYRTHTGEGAWVFDMAGDPEPYVVTLGFQFDEGWEPDDTTSAMGVAWMEHLRAVMSDDVVLRQTEVHYTDTEGDKVQVHPMNVAGQDGGGKLPQNCALLVRKFTGLSGRKFRGRMYWPAILAESWVDNVGVIAPATVTTLQGIFDAVWAACAVPTDSTISLLHHDKSESTPVSAFQVANVIATQRRRLRR